MKSELEKELIHINKQLIRLSLQQERLQKRLKEVQEQLENEESDEQDEIEAEGVIHYRIVTQSQRRKKSSNVNRQGQRPKYTTAIITGEAAYDERRAPKIGDFVRIVNPKAGQPNRGHIRGFCADGKAKVCCQQNTIITRNIKNLRYHVFEPCPNV